MSSYGDNTYHVQSGLSRLAVVAVFSSLICIFSAVIALRLIPVRSPALFSWALAFYFQAVQSLLEVILGSQQYYVRDIAYQTGAPVLVLLTVSVAVILGFISIIRIDNSHRRLKGVTLGMTAVGIGLATLLVTCPVIIRDFSDGFVTLKLFSIRNSREKCEKEIVVLGCALTKYASANVFNYPDAKRWCDILVEGHYVDGEKLLLWMAGHQTWHCAINWQCQSSSPQETVLLFECYPGWNFSGTRDDFIMNHESSQGKGGYVYCKNGQLKFVTAETLGQLIWE